MKCLKCHFENVEQAEFCGNCGAPLVKKVPLKNKKKWFILGSVCVFLIAVFGVVLFLNKKGGFEDPFDDIDNITLNESTDFTNEHKAVNSFLKNIENDYASGLLTSDEYILQLAYSIYDVDKLDVKYRSLDLDYNRASELFETAFSMRDELSDEVFMYLFEKYTLADVLWDVPEANLSNSNGNDYEAVPLASSEANLSKLDQVILSNNHHFLVYYTKDGANAITDSDARKIANFLESMIDAYQKEYGLDFVYSAQYDFFSDIALSTCPTGSAKGKACNLLKKNNIDIHNLNTAMPVFIIDTDASNTGALGYYVPPIGALAEVVLKANDIFNDMGTQIDNIITTYSFPFFVVSSSLDDFDDTKIVLAHELFHHYQQYICGNGSYGECESNNFTTETTADLAASTVVGVNKTKTALNGHARIYTSDITSSIDQVGLKEYGEKGLGYGAFVFAYHYAQIVPNGTNHLFESMKTTDTLKYLYDHSSGKYKSVLLALAEHNLTLDYDNKLFIANEGSKVLLPSNYKNISSSDNRQTNTINYSSMHYYYIDPNDYEMGAQLSFEGDSSNLTLLLFVKENNTYQYLYTHSLTRDFVINVDDFSNYSEIVIAIVNSDIEKNLNYFFEIDNNGMKTPTVTAESLNLETLKETIENASSFVCYEIDEDDDFKNIMQIKIDFNEEEIVDLYVKATIQMKKYDPSNPAFSIAQKVAETALYTIQKVYEEQFKYFRILTESKADKYSVTFQVTRNFYDALNNTIRVDGEDKYSIIRSIQKEGFTCEFH